MAGRGAVGPKSGKYGAWVLQGPPHLERPAAHLDQVKLRLFCVPQAGCGAWVYHGWSKKLPAEVEVCAPIQLCARGSCPFWQECY
eukprot:3169453-Pyramimonas_sp.AAC.2